MQADRRDVFLWAVVCVFRGLETKTPFGVDACGLYAVLPTVPTQVLLGKIIEPNTKCIGVCDEITLREKCCGQNPPPLP